LGIDDSLTEIEEDRLTKFYKKIINDKDKKIKRLESQIKKLNNKVNELENKNWFMNTI